jgi:hypothetical protein
MLAARLRAPLRLLFVRPFSAAKAPEFHYQPLFDQVWCIVFLKVRVFFVCRAVAVSRRGKFDKSFVLVCACVVRRQAPDTTTKYKKLANASKHVSVQKLGAHTFLKVESEALRILSAQAMTDIAHLLRCVVYPLCVRVVSCDEILPLFSLPLLRAMHRLFL